MRIQFYNIPKSPLVDAKTQLRFAVQNMTNSKNINDLHARVVVTTNSSGQMRIFKFDNISSSNGDFSVNYFFPDSGIYQVMTRVDSNNLSTLGSFKVDVPFQPFGTITAPTSSFSLIVVAGIIIAVVALSLLLVIQRRQRISRLYASFFDSIASQHINYWGYQRYKVISGEDNVYLEAEPEDMDPMEPMDIFPVVVVVLLALGRSSKLIS